MEPEEEVNYYDQDDEGYLEEGSNYSYEYQEDLEEVIDIGDKMNRINTKDGARMSEDRRGNKEEEIQTKHIKNELGQTFIQQSDVYFQMMQKVKGEVKELVCRSENDCLLILHEFGWSLSKLRDRYFESYDRIFTKLGFADEEKLGLKERDGLFAGSEEALCELCYCESEKVGSCNQGHIFCADCWQQYFKQQLSEKNPFMKCMQVGCTSYIRHSFILDLLESNQTDETAKACLQNYKKFLGMSYVEENKNIKYCPAIGCIYAGERMEGDLNVTSLKCPCGTTFCFRCNQPSHYPSTCKQQRDFMEMLNRDDANLLWIVQNAKLCPYCERAVERSMGCNYIRCAAPCNKSFCYVCEKPWEDDKDGSHHRSAHMNCNAKFDDGTKDGKISDKDKTQKLLERISFYIGRFKECLRSCELIQKNKLEMAEATRQILFEQLSVNRMDSQFLIDAFDNLLESRRTLQWSYSFSYFLSEEQVKTKALFEDSLIQFSQISEALAILLSTDFANYTKEIKATDFSKNFSPQILEKYCSLKQRISILSNAVKTASRSLLESVDSGQVLID